MPEEIDHIEELQKRLYTRDPDSVPKRKFGILRPIKHNVESTWGETTIPKDRGQQRMGVTGFRRFFIFSLVFFLAAVGLALFSVFRGAVTLSSKNVDLSILGNSFVAGGEELPIQVEIANKNSTDLLDARLVLQYPKGATDETGSEVARFAEELGTIASGKTRSIAFSTILYGEQGLSRDITATLSYHLAGSTATFEKSQTFSVMISSSPIELTVDGPSVTASDQPFTLTVRSVFTGDQPLEDPIVRVEYPTGFTFLSASSAPSSGNNVWSLGTLEKGTEQVIAIRGRITAVEGDEKAFRVYLGTPVSDADRRIEVAYNSALHSLLIEQPFIAADITIGTQSGDVVALSIGSELSGSVTWKNMTPYTIANPVFSLALSGEGVDPESVRVIDGYYDELLRTLSWTSASNDDIASIAPGDTGTLLFGFAPRDGVVPEDIRLSLSVEGTIPERENEFKSIINLDELAVRYAARIQFAANALYSTGPIKNTGPYPPKAHQETTYSVTWTVRPTDNALSGAVATATLPSSVTWAGVIIPQSEALSYNPDTREVRWNIGVLPRATSTPLSKSVSFQIKTRPTESDIGSEIPLLSETAISATDTVANVTIEAIRPGLSTRLSTDPSYSPGEEKVIP